MSFPIKRSRSYIYSIAKVTSQCHRTSSVHSIRLLNNVTLSMLHTGTGIDPDDIVYWIITVGLTQGHNSHKTYLKRSSISFVVLQWETVRKIEIHHMQVKEKWVHFWNFIYSRYNILVTLNVSESHLLW